MKITGILLTSFLSLTLLHGIHAATADADHVTVSAYNTLTYSPSEIVAHPGQKVVLTFKNESTLPRSAMAHDWVLLRAGADVKAYANVAMTDCADDHIPKSLAKEVLVSIPMLGPLESRTVTFTAPTVPGSYPYLCSCPGHSQGGMKGVLIVK